jgi:hypothetical protein
MIQIYDTIKSKIKRNDLIDIGTIGVVLNVYNEGNDFLVEFIDSEGNTIGDGMDTVSNEDIELFSNQHPDGSDM